MAKPIQYYALTKAFGYTHGFDVLGVTSEAHGQVYGRSSISDTVTHVRRSAVLYRFPDGTSEEFAKAAKRRADLEHVRHGAEIEKARARVVNLTGHRDMCVLDAAKGLGDAVQKKCGRCGSASGNDWSQCRGGECPMGGPR